MNEKNKKNEKDATCPVPSADRSVCSVPEQTTLHASGLRTMTADAYPGVPMRIRYTVAFPSGCCPVSRNPREGSTLTLSYRPDGRVLEVYALRSLLRQFVGGWPGNAAYGPERNMEGAVQLVCQMAADALGVPVRGKAGLVLDTGLKEIFVVAEPRESTP